jgi:hypothetical protein
VAIDPREFVNNQFEQFKDRYRQTYKRLRKQHGNNVEAFNRDLARLDADADQYEAKHATAIAQIAYLQKAVESGLDAEAGLRAMERAAGIPSPSVQGVTPSATGMSLAQQVGDIGKLTEIMNEFFIEDPWYAKPKLKKDSEAGMTSLFTDGWDAQNLSDPRNIAKRAGYIQSFARAAANNNLTNKVWVKISDLKTGSVEIRRRIAPDTDFGRAFNGKFSDTKPKPPTPLGKSVAEQKKPVYPTMGGWNPYVGRVKSRPAAIEAPKRQFNKKTGQTRISYDGGKTWQIE